MFVARRSIRSETASARLTTAAPGSEERAITLSRSRSVSSRVACRPEPHEGSRRNSVGASNKSAHVAGRRNGDILKLSATRRAG